MNNQKQLVHSYEPGSLLKINCKKWQHIGLVPLDPTISDLRKQAIAYYDIDFWNVSSDWIVNKLTPPILFIKTTLSKISPVKAYEPIHLDRDYLIHQFLHLGRVWIFVTHPEQGLQEFFVEAKPDKKRSIDLYLKAKFGDLYDPTDWNQ